ncbi:MAG: ATP-binding protein, partial [Candidatus Riflebacteria bacterium]
NPRIIDLNQTVLDLRNMFKRLIGENIELIVNTSELHPRIFIDPNQLDQILTNLVVNARDALQGFGNIIIETDFTETFEMMTFPGQTLSAGKYAVLSISDNGIGMDEATMAQIFEPFFTTKSENRGTGLGLSTVYGIVEQNQGGISVYSEQSRGTTFRIYLPAKEESAHEVGRKKSVNLIPEGDETIMVVEDEQVLLNLTVTMLHKIGYRVLAFSSPLEAIAAAKNDRVTFDMILSDVIMPHINGSSMVEEILKIRPGVKYLFMSGYTPEIIATKGILHKDSPLVEKPFDMLHLAARIREILDKNE